MFDFFKRGRLVKRGLASRKRRRRRFVLPGGQSGNPLSPHYDDLFELYRRGEGVPIAFTPQEMKANTMTRKKPRATQVSSMRRKAVIIRLP